MTPAWNCGCWSQPEAVLTSAWPSIQHDAGMELLLLVSLLEFIPGSVASMPASVAARAQCRWRYTSRLWHFRCMAVGFSLATAEFTWWHLQLSGTGFPSGCVSNAWQLVSASRQLGSGRVLAFRWRCTPQLWHCRCMAVGFSFAAAGFSPRNAWVLHLTRVGFLMHDCGHDWLRHRRLADAARGPAALLVSFL